jgi:hypothetical protein
VSKHRKLRRRCLLFREKKGIGAKKISEHPLCQRKNEGGQEKRLANPAGGKIITKTAKNSSFTP